MPIYGDNIAPSTRYGDFSYSTPYIDGGPICSDPIDRMSENGTFSDAGMPLMSPMGRGPKGDKGDKGDVGPQGPKGDKGDMGEPGPAGTTDYNDLENKPSIESVPLVGDITFIQLGLQSLTNQEIEALLT